MNPLWTDLASRAGLALDADRLEKLSCYLDLLFEANATMNLTRITDRAAAEVQHVGDALTLLPFLPTGAHRLADVGAGGGVPGIPLAIVRPDAQVVLIEATQKKAAFLTRCVESLELPNVRVVPKRAEDAGADTAGGLRESFDVVVARAVATMDWLAEWCLPLARPGGVFLAMKGQKAADELPQARKVIQLLGGGEATLHAVELPGTTNHVIVRVPKAGKTDKRYPRPATQAKGRSLAIK
ncbi:MAG: 16S rRNA (guanine(527)-N(7))-methyltransferase RsmG [Tepidisphaeraceae bacterium]